MKTVIGIAILGCLLAACSKDDTAISETVLDAGINISAADTLTEDTVKKIQVPSVKLKLTVSQNQFIERWQDFAFDLYRTATKGQGNTKSLLLSPLSASFLLAMLNEATQGKGSEELMALMKCGAMDKQELNELCGYLTANLPGVDSTVKLKLANMVATDNSVELEGLFRRTMEEYYQAETPSLDFASNAATDQINSWCLKATDGFLPRAIDKILPDQLAVFLNVVYLNALWTEKFDPAQTQLEQFSKYTGGVELPIMRQQNFSLPYMQNELYSMLCLPFGGCYKWWMKVLLPNEGKTVDDVVKSLNGKKWREQSTQYQKYDLVDIKLPRFEAENDIELKSVLKEMGVADIFTTQADFSPMGRGLAGSSVSRVFQKNKVKVTEEGAEMAAASTAALPSGSRTKIQFYATRPFVYVVEEADTGIILFIGTFLGEE